MAVGSSAFQEEEKTGRAFANEHNIKIPNTENRNISEEISEFTRLFQEKNTIWIRDLIGKYYRDLDDLNRKHNWNL